MQRSTRLLGLLAHLLHHGGQPVWRFGGVVLKFGVFWGFLIGLKWFVNGGWKEFRDQKLSIQSIILKR